MEEKKKIKIFINEPCLYTKEKLLASIKKFSSDFCEIIEDLENADLQWEYDEEKIEWNRVFKGKLISNSYHIRKGLIRKAQMAMYLQKYCLKNSKSILQESLPFTIILDIHQNELGWCLAEAAEEIENEKFKGKFWILKPSLMNGAVGIHIIKSFNELKKYIIKHKEMQQWVLQQYIENPFLIENKKFHLRVYILAVGSLKIYLYKEILALFASEIYNLNNTKNYYSHITNTCVQTSSSNFNELKTIQLFSSLKDKNGLNTDIIFEKIKMITKEIFQAYKGEFSGFFPLESCFELFGIDFLIDQYQNIWLLEINSGPDFKQTGNYFNYIITELLEDTWKIILDSFYNISKGNIRMGKYYLVYEDESIISRWGNSNMVLIE